MQTVKRPTIAFFGSSLGGSYSQEKWSLWRGVMEGVRTLGLRLLYVAGDDFSASPQAALYDWIGKNNVAGIIAWHSFFDLEATEVVVHQYLEKFSPLPVVLIEQRLPGVSAVLVDNLQGMRDLIQHLVVHHGHSRIAFVSPPRSLITSTRQAAFEQVMQEYGCYDPSLVGTLEQLDRRGLVPGIDYTAVVAHSDFSAIEIVEVLRRRGIRIAEDVAVAGFNDGYEARSAMPALTTMRLPFRRMGRTAVELLYDQLLGRSGGNIVTLPMQLVLRSSCGCLEPLAESAIIDSFAATRQSLEELFLDGHEELLAQMARSMGTPLENHAIEWAERLFRILTDELRTCEQGHAFVPERSRVFLSDLQALLQRAIDEGVNINRWNEAISILRRYVLPYLNPEQRFCFEDRTQQARILVGTLAIRAEIHRNWYSMRSVNLMREMVANLLVAMNEEDFLSALEAGLAKLNLESLFLVLYENQPEGKESGRLFFGYRNGERIKVPPEEAIFSLEEILPSFCMKEIEEEECLIMEALHLGSEQLGYLVIASQPPVDPVSSDLFNALKGEISSAIHNLQLRLQLHEAVRAAEEANQLKSRFLSMVSHELRTPINLIVGLSEMAMRQQLKGRRKSLAILSRYLEQIYVSGQHLDRLIRDVLDLASSQVGQMNIIHQPVDMVPVLEDVAVMGRQLAEQKNLEFITYLERPLPQVWGDKTRLRQVLLNLLSNAVKFTAHGYIRLSAVQDGSQVHISVSDTGLGIAPEEQRTIFDEFHQTNRTMVRGYGGIGLGLAITRRLVEMHGGKIWVESDGLEGSGSTFHIALPAMSEAVAPSLTVPSSREGQVIILTDRPADSSDLIKYLKRNGFDIDVRPLSPVPLLVESLSTSPPGAVVLDLAPDAELGWKLIKGLKENSATQDVPVLFYKLFSESGAGSVLTLDFMLKPLDADQLVRALERYGLKGGQHDRQKVILVVDDEPGILNLHAELIETELPDAQVLTAPDGKKGLEIMRREHPDLVLLDLMMPEIDGFNVIQRMQEDPLLCSIPVIVLTAQVLTREDMKRLNKGVSTVLSKGVFRREEIIQRIEHALTQSMKSVSEGQRLVRQAMVYIHEHYKEPISRADIAGYLNVNEQYLSRCFHKEVGIGPMTYLGRYRIHQAKKLLSEGRFSVTQVALEVGFSSQSYFSRIFQQETGQTPTAYMRRPFKDLS